MALDFPTAVLVSIIVESILFGLFTVLFTLCTYLLLVKRTITGPIRIRFFAALVMMYTLAVVHIGVNIRYTLNGFTGSLLFFTSQYNLLSALRIIIYVLQSLLGDGITIYRLYIVCGADYRVLLPMFIFLMGNVASGIGAIVTYFKKKTIFLDGAEPLRWLAAFFLITLVINLSGTAILTIRIALTRRKVSGIVQDTGFSTLTIILLDPGIIYSISLITLLILFHISAVAEIMALEWETPIIGIVFALIIVRIGFRKLWNGRLDFVPLGNRTRAVFRGRVVSPSHQGHTQVFNVPLGRVVPKRTDLMETNDEYGTNKAIVDC